MFRLNTSIYSRLYYRQVSINRGKSIISQGKSIINKSDLKHPILVENNIQIITDDLERRIEIENKLNNILKQRFRNKLLKQEREKERTEWGMDDIFKL